MTVIIGCHGIRIISICVSRLVFNFSFTRYVRSSIRGRHLENGRQEPGSSAYALTNPPTHFTNSMCCRKSEIIALIAATFGGMPGGCLLFIPFYHPMHDFFHVPSEVTTVSILLFFVAIVWKYDRKSNRYSAPKKSDFLSKLLMGHLIGHYLVFLGTVIFINPEEMISIGLHEKIGNCNETVPVHTVLKVTIAIQLFSRRRIDTPHLDFRHSNAGSTYVWKITMKNTTIFIVCLAEEHPKKAAIGTQYAVPRSSEWSVKKWVKAKSANVSLFSLGIAPNILLLFQLSPTLRSWYSVHFISTTTRILTSSTKTNAENYNCDLRR